MGKLVRMIDEEGTLSVIAADSTDIVREMRSIHGTSKVCSAALGRMLTAATMMGSTLKGKNDSITVKNKRRRSVRHGFGGFGLRRQCQRLYRAKPIFLCL